MTLTKEELAALEAIEAATPEREGGYIPEGRHVLRLTGYTWRNNAANPDVQSTAIGPLYEFECVSSTNPESPAGGKLVLPVRINPNKQHAWQNKNDIETAHSNMLGLAKAFLAGKGTPKPDLTFGDIKMDLPDSESFREAFLGTQVLCITEPKKEGSKYLVHKFYPAPDAE